MALTLSDYLQRDFAVERVDAALLELGAGAIRFPTTQPAYFHLVLVGRVQLKLEEGGPPVELQAGDFALLLYGAGHTLSGMRGRSRSVHTQENWSADDQPAVLKLGSAPQDARVLSGRLQLTRTLHSAPVDRALRHLLCYRDLQGASASTASYMTQIDRNCRAPGASAYAHALAQLYFVQALRQVHGELREIFPVHIGSPEIGRMTAVVRKIRMHPERQWTVASMAREIGYSRSSFAAKFLDYSGMSPIKFVAKIRLTHAATLLKNNPELPLWQVAKRVGYLAQASFTRAFKSQFDVSPREYASRIRVEAPREIRSKGRPSDSAHDARARAER
ncbi:MAG: AraC family transcriptional regulator [Steroidobacteraceae bacterium]